MCRLARCGIRTALVELLHDAIEIGITRAKAPREPIATALGDRFAVRDHLELTGLTRRNDGIDVEALPDEGYETRDLGVVVLSRRAMNDLDLHSVLQFRAHSLAKYANEWGIRHPASRVRRTT